MSELQQQIQVLPVRKAGESRFLGKRVHFIGIGGCGMSGLAKIREEVAGLKGGKATDLEQLQFRLAVWFAICASSGPDTGPRLNTVVRV